MKWAKLMASHFTSKKKGRRKGRIFMLVLLEDLEEVPEWQGYESFEWAGFGLADTLLAEEKNETEPSPPLVGSLWKCRGKCERVLELNGNNFYPTPHGTGFRVACRLCVNEKRKTPVPRGFKTCSGGCGKVLRENRENFYRDKRSKKKFLPVCRSCYSLRYGEEPLNGHQQCKGACGQVLKLSSEFFSRNKKARSGFGYKCKICVNEEHKARRLHIE